MEVATIMQEIQMIAGKNLSQKCNLYLFGSFAKKTNHDTSDIDLALENCTKTEFDNFQSSLATIQTLRKIDLVNLNNVDDAFKNDILKTAIK